MWAIKFQSAEIRAYDGSIMDHDGEWKWIIKEPEGWVEATSCHACETGINADVKTFTTKEAAEKFAKRWAKIYHPWYGKPNGVYEFVEIKPRYTQVQTGWTAA